MQKGDVRTFSAIFGSRVITIGVVPIQAMYVEPCLSMYVVLELILPEDTDIFFWLIRVFKPHLPLLIIRYLTEFPSKGSPILPGNCIINMYNLRRLHRKRIQRIKLAAINNCMTIILIKYCSSELGRINIYFRRLH